MRKFDILLIDSQYASIGVKRMYDIIDYPIMNLFYRDFMI